MPNRPRFIDPTLDTQKDRAAVESLLIYLERELDVLGYPLASRQCRLVSIAMIEQDIHRQTHRLGTSV